MRRAKASTRSEPKIQLRGESSPSATAALGQGKLEVRPPAESFALDPFVEKHFAQINDYTRHLIGCVLQWYSFFIGANILACGWFVQKLGEKANEMPARVLSGVAFLFASSGVAAVISLWAVLAYLADSNERLETMLHTVPSPMPYKAYRCAIRAMVYTLIAMLLAWGLFAVMIATHSY